MTRTYKVALGVAGLILAFSVVYYAGQPSSAESDPLPDLASADDGPLGSDARPPLPPPRNLTPTLPDPEPAPVEPLVEVVEDEPTLPEPEAPTVPTIDLTTLRATPLATPPGGSEPVDLTPAPSPEVAVVEEPAPTPVIDPTPPPPPAPVEPTTYTVRRGDTLSSIAVRLYGQERRWVDIAQANPTIDPIRLRVGQTLKLPSDARVPPPDQPEIDAPVAERSHTIQSGENLSSIAQRYYGRAARWRVLFNANRDVLGNNPNAIRAGMVIKVPP
ncbi:MAG: LysM peptidoglycan-binding domain-containing protein, partial [Planctomycetota bacterium]